MISKISEPNSAKHNLTKKKEKLSDKNSLILSNLREYYEKKEKMGPDNYNIILRKSEKIIEKIVEEAKKKKGVGMIFGKVQSGKTLNYISYTVHAFLKDIFDIVIILNATNNDLYNQNRERIKKVIEFLNEEEGNVEIRFEEINKIGYKFRTISQRSIEGKKTIICSLKEKQNIQKILDWLENYQYDEKSKKCPRVLIIDDEGDQASLNNIRKRVDKHVNGEEVKETKKQSAVNERIVELKTRLNAFFLSVTATPYANMLLPTGDPLSPDFIEKIIPGVPHKKKKYLGISEVWGDLHSKIVRRIEENEIDDLEKINIEGEFPFPKSLKKAISTFLFISQCLGGEYRMWIHTHIDTSHHRIITEKINKFIRELRKLASSSNDYFKKDLLKFIELGVWEVEGKKMGQLSEGYKKEILRKTEKLINDLETKEINSKKDAQRWLGGKPLVNEIIIGSKLLDRGVTIERLTVAYITINSENADTTLQRARWFGYKQEKVINKFLRVWCTKKIDDDYFEIKKMEESFHEDIDFINSNNLSLKDWGSGNREKAFFIGGEGRWLTRRTIRQNKNKFLNFTQYRVEDDKEEEWKFIEDAANNFQIAKNIYNRPFKEKEYQSIDEFERKTPKVVRERILKKCGIPQNFWENWKSVSRKKNPLKVILIKQTVKEHAWHTLDDKLEVPSPFTGGKGGKKTKEGYKGDKYLHEYDENKDKFLLKVWTFELFLKDKRVKYQSQSSCKKDVFIFYSLGLPKTFWTITNKD